MGRSGRVTDEEAAIAAKAEEVSRNYSADIYFYSGQIGDAGFAHLIRELTPRRRYPTALFILGRALIKRGAKGGLMPAGRTPGNSPRVCHSEWQCVGNA